VSIYDGRTTQLDLEAGALPVSSYYKAKKGISLSNYGVSVSHDSERLKTMDGVDSNGSPMMTHAPVKAGKTGNQWSVNQATQEQLKETDVLIRAGLDQGSTRIGVMVGYYPTAGSTDISLLKRLKLHCCRVSIPGLAGSHRYGLRRSFLG